MNVGSGPGQWRRVLEKGGEQMDPGEVGNPMGEVWEGMGLQRGGGACEGWRSNSGGESEWVGGRGGDGGWGRLRSELLPQVAPGGDVKHTRTRRLPRGVRGLDQDLS